MIAQRYRLNHHEISVEPHVADIIEDIVSAFDEPFADDSVIPSYYVSQVAAGFVKVALTGLGGDELFGGYRRHLGVRVGRCLCARAALAARGHRRPRHPPPSGTEELERRRGSPEALLARLRRRCRPGATRIP